MPHARMSYGHGVDLNGVLQPAVLQPIPNGRAAALLTGGQMVPQWAFALLSAELIRLLLLVPVRLHPSDPEQHVLVPPFKGGGG